MAVIGGARPRPGWFGLGSDRSRDRVVVRVPGGGRTRDDGRSRDRDGGAGRGGRRAGGGSGKGAGNGTRNPRSQATPDLARMHAAALALRPAHATLPLDRRPALDSIPRRRSRATLRAGRRGRRLGLLLGGIVLAFLLAFFSLAQTVRVTATDYEVDRLHADQAQLQAQQQELLSDLNRLGREPAIRKQAIDLGLFPLAEPVVVRAR